MKPLDPLQELESGAVAPDPAASHRLFQFGCGTLAAAAAWCLYRTGKGPYPGLFALGRKKKIKGWD